MSSLTLDYTNALAATIGATHGLTDAEVDTLVAKFPKHHENIEELRTTGESGFFELPHQDTKALKALVKEHKGKWENLVVLGHGGATISPAALIDSLCGPNWNLRSAKERKNAPKVFIPHHPDPAAINELMTVVDPKTTLFLISSRTGNTAETNGLFMWLEGLVKRKCGKTAVAKQIVIATDPERSPLVEAAKAAGCSILPVPSNIACRFDVLGNSSLFPAALCGVDIDKLLAGAAAMDTRCRHDKAFENPAYMHSLIHYLLTRKRRKTMHATMGFDSRLEPVIAWYDHLLAVSLGKMLNKKGKAVHVGPSPASCIGPAGCYGQMQLYQEGPFDKVLTFINVTDPGHKIAIPKSFAKVEELAYLGGHELGELAEQAYIGAAATITGTGRPNMTITLDALDAEALGGLFYMLMLSVAMSAELYGIDAFNQPGVDANKQAVFAQLGRAGFEDKAQALAAYRERDVKTC